MVSAFGMVILPQNLSTGNGQVPGWSCTLSVAMRFVADTFGGVKKLRKDILVDFFRSGFDGSVRLPAR